jgi:hypothetical protein
MRIDENKPFAPVTVFFYLSNQFIRHGVTQMGTDVIAADPEKLQYVVN